MLAIFHPVHKRKTITTLAIHQWHRCFLKTREKHWWSGYFTDCWYTILFAFIACASLALFSSLIKPCCKCSAHTFCSSLLPRWSVWVFLSHYACLSCWDVTLNVSYSRIRSRWKLQCIHSCAHRRMFTVHLQRTCSASGSRLPNLHTNFHKVISCNVWLSFEKPASHSRPLFLSCLQVILSLKSKCKSSYLDSAMI